ncbi:Phosphatidylinositol 4-kinase stt4 [Leucoagaricus sp. SymC.cos]|nr:Phosphatidylinositol 4-kinase stt4 [Leucoagaricus sp. SymC.cos]
MDSEPSIDTYAWETMSESLVIDSVFILIHLANTWLQKLASVGSIALGEIDKKLFARTTLLLSNESPISDNLVQEAALKATAILVRSFPETAAFMATQLRRFVTSPLPLFEFEFAEGRAPPLAAAAKCLALCIKLAPGDDLIMSNMYSLLNFIAATSKDTHDDLQGPDAHDPGTLHSLETGLRGLSEDEKRLTGISTISVVTRLALEFYTEEVTKLTISMLLQRLRSAEPTVEAAIAYNLVDLALIAPEGSFIDIIRSFSAINRSANPDDPRFSNNMVLAAQTRLAQDLNRRPELFGMYLTELLTLFLDKGVAIQNLRIGNPQVKIDDMIEQLASLLLPIDALLVHTNFKPWENTSPEAVSLFRNLWFLCVLFNFTATDDKDGTAMDWLRPALRRIAAKTPPMVVEETHDAFASDIEYNTVIRQEYADSVLVKQRTRLTKYIMLRSSELRSLSTGQVVFLLAMHDIESLRALEGLPSSLVTYFINESLNKNPVLSACMEGIAEQVIRGCQAALTTKASQQALPKRLSGELRQLVISSTHRIAKAREVASKYLNRLLVSFPSLMCDPHLVYAILEVLTLLQRGTENEFIDEYEPTWEYHSDRANITIQLTDNCQTRKEILDNLSRNANSWFELALSRAPLELQSTLQKYLAVNQSVTGTDSAELGASIAERFGKDVGPVHRHLFSLKSLSRWNMDQAKTLTSQIAIKSYYLGEAAGFRFVGKEYCKSVRGADTPQSEICALREKLQSTMADIRSKNSSLTIQELRRLLYRCAAVLVSLDRCDYDLLHYVVTLPFAVATPSAMVVAAEIWSWLIAEKSACEVALTSEIVSAWSLTIKHGRGIFSRHINYHDPFESPIVYAPTDKEFMEKELTSARKLLSPHILVLHLLYSRLQAARYYQPNIMFLIQQLVLRSTRNHKRFSTHALAREPRFSFLLFGFEALKSSHLDAFCENLLREALYRLAFSWYSARAQWTYGADRAQLHADLKALSEFLSYLQTDTVRGLPSISSLSPLQSVSRTSCKTKLKPVYSLKRFLDYSARLRDLSTPLRLLTESELFRLSVWINPTNDSKRSTDLVGATERGLIDTSWLDLIRCVWNIDPAIAISLTERFKSPLVRNEVARLVRSSPKDVLGISDAVHLLLGDGFDPNVRRDHKYLLLWAPVSPITANTFFERRYNNQPQILQYAHRVLEEHPVELTFFFIPQIVQALRYDTLGYVAQFIFETAKISQLFCHQIIWNMKANCFKDDAAEIEDPLKPTLDLMTDAVVNSLSGEARDFYDREFNFFNEVTSISGKLKPFIKKTKPEKKAKIDEEMTKIRVDVGVYLPSNPDGVVVDIDKKSGRPLQSHAKAPFMATFKVRKERVEVESDPDSVVDGAGIERRTEYDVWQQAIFKVGDDCRQDVLALQVIAIFKNIYTNVGLPLYLFPYRVTATAPGCGVIDVVPNATSRDEMGRAKVNDLLDFFIAKYGGQDTVAFQRARLNFVQSMAAYSLACYILQIKDRHNGNIMIDGEGHIVHIDFGFLFDIDKLISLQGVKFEPNSFKLNHEMIVLMGGRYSQGYQLFQSLTVKAFLAIRPYAEQIVNTVQLMLDTSLPSFKGEPTIRRLRDRFALQLNDRQAAEFMMSTIRNAHENVRSTAYDEFQRVSEPPPNAIPSLILPLHSCKTVR